MNHADGESGRSMFHPPHLGELIRESMDVGWNVTETAARLGCERGTLSRLLNGQAGVSENMALALEGLGRSTADHWTRMQASYEVGAGAKGEWIAGMYQGTGCRHGLGPWNASVFQRLLTIRRCGMSVPDRCIDPMR